MTRVRPGVPLGANRMVRLVATVGRPHAPRLLFLHAPVREEYGTTATRLRVG